MENLEIPKQEGEKIIASAFDKDVSANDYKDALLNRHEDRKEQNFILDDPNTRKQFISDILY